MSAAVVAFLTWTALAGAERPEELARAEAELKACAVDKACGDSPALSLRVGYLRLSAGDAAGAADQLRAVAPPPLLGAHHAYYLGQALFYSGDPLGAAERFQWALDHG